MNIPQGPWFIDDTLTFTVITHRFDTGAVTDADAVPAYRIYEDETGAAILTGNMAKLDDANTTGFYSEQITLSAANGFEVGKSYNIYVSVAVNSVTGGVSGGFKVIATLATPTNITAGTITTTTNLTNLPAITANWLTAAGIADNAITAAKIADGAIDAATFAAGAINAAAIAADAITDAKVAADVTIASVTGAVGSVAGQTLANLDVAVSTLATAAALTTVDDFLDTEIAAIKAKTDSLNFTVAGQVDSNVQYVNDVQVNGTGALGDEWGP